MPVIFFRLDSCKHLSRVGLGSADALAAAGLVASFDLTLIKMGVRYDAEVNRISARAAII